ncbi:MAG TPA: CPBP family intramembrane glutamic endopeptidase [Dongiaceae bacterium]|nr:CPBP family intramembrane glutamic endopeptidase [Dongiaceae bacterium]
MFYFRQALKLCAAAACVAGSVAAYRFLLHPAIEAALSLDAETSSIVRRTGIFVSVVLAYAAFVRFYERRPPRELAPRWVWTLVAAAAGVASIGVTLLALYATGHYRVVEFRGFAGVADVLSQIAIAAVIEELAFRGVLFRIVEETFGSAAALVGSAVVFAVAHLANSGLQGFTLVTITLVGVMWAGIFIVWRNLWVAAAHHCSWNATIFLIGVPLSGEDWRAQAPLATSTHGSVLWTGGTFGPEDSLINIAVMIVLGGGLLWLARRRGRLVRGGVVASGRRPAAPGPQSR